MSCIRLNLIDQHRALSGEIHGSEMDTVMAALVAEPETIDELITAMKRFAHPDDHQPAFAGFRAGENPEPYDAGIMIVDLAARVVAAETTWDDVPRSGYVPLAWQYVYDPEEELQERCVPWQLSDDWLIVRGLPEYEGVRGQRVAARQALAGFDARAVLYGDPLPAFLAREIYAAAEIDPDTHDAELLTRIHEKWLMTPRADLRSATPREILFAKRDFIDRDLSSRSLQWSWTNQNPPPLPRDSDAYKYAGIGTHEWVIYYDYVRHLLTECQTWRIAGKTEPVATAQLRDEAAIWLETPSYHYEIFIPARLLESERERTNISMTERTYMMGDDSPTLEDFMDEDMGPGFWHMDGCNMDQGFAFSYYKTIEEYEEEERRFAEYNRRFKEKYEAGELRSFGTTDDSGPDVVEGEWVQ